VPYKTHKLEAPPTFTTTNREELLGFYREMSLIRKMEVAANTLYTGKDRLIRGFLHLYNGQVGAARGREFRH
jgi:pyruvate dehydrogenase E1 component alpha subunit